MKQYFIEMLIGIFFAATVIAVVAAIGIDPPFVYQGL